MYGDLQFVLRGTVDLCQALCVVAVGLRGFAFAPVCRIRSIHKEVWGGSREGMHCTCRRWAAIRRGWPGTQGANNAGLDADVPAAVHQLQGVLFWTAKYVRNAWICLTSRKRVSVNMVDIRMVARPVVYCT